ncbi:MAG: hypothetical protein AB4040_12720 [Synechococcus sp.]
MATIAWHHPYIQQRVDSCYLGSSANAQPAALKRCIPDWSHLRQLRR